MSGAACETNNPGATNSSICYTVGAAADIDGDAVNGEVILVKMALDGATTADPPTNLTQTFPGDAAGSCTDAAGANDFRFSRS